jgi:hypothetical protein
MVGLAERPSYIPHPSLYHRHSRESGNPIIPAENLGPRFRGDNRFI